MIDSSPQPPAAPAAPAVLAYRAPADEVERLSPPLVCMTSIFIAAVVFATVVVSVLFAITAGNGWPLLIIPAVLLALVAATLRLRRGGGRARSVAMGLWIGLGVGLLAQGVCWGIGLLA